ncbi:hypothetical protein JTB14_010917 [Gonioctena quinquepunctata]|nr:hypothetical protein JTB14_010917 [Gonioctena quinquepunctata]
MLFFLPRALYRRGPGTAVSVVPPKVAVPATNPPHLPIRISQSRRVDCLFPIHHQDMSCTFHELHRQRTANVRSRFGQHCKVGQDMGKIMSVNIVKKLHLVPLINLS